MVCFICEASVFAEKKQIDKSQRLAKARGFGWKKKHVSMKERTKNTQKQLEANKYFSEG